MRKVVALTAIAGVTLASSEFDGAADNNLALGLIDLQRIQRHPLYLDSDVSVAEPLELIRQRELIRAHFPILSKDADDEMFTVPAEMESKDRRSTFSIFDKKQGEKSEKTEKTEKGSDHEFSVFLDFVKTQPKEVQRAIFEAHPIFTTNTKTKNEEEPKNTQERSNYSNFNKREAVKKPVEEPKKDSVNARSVYTNFTKRETVQKVKKELGALYAQWLNQELVQNDDELYGIKSIMKKDKDSWKGGVLSLDDEDNELFNLAVLIDESHKTTIGRHMFTSQPQPQPKPAATVAIKKDYKSILDDAAGAIREIQEKNSKNPGLRPINLVKLVL